MPDSLWGSRFGSTRLCLGIPSWSKWSVLRQNIWMLLQERLVHFPMQLCWAVVCRMLGGENNRFYCLRLWKEEFLKAWLWSIVLGPNCLVRILLCIFFSSLSTLGFLVPSYWCGSHPQSNNCRNKQTNKKPGSVCPLSKPHGHSSFFHAGRVDTPIRKTFYLELQAQRGIFEIVFSEVISHSRTKYRWKKPQISAFYSQFIYVII